MRLQFKEYSAYFLFGERERTNVNNIIVQKMADLETSFEIFKFNWIFSERMWLNTLFDINDLTVIGLYKYASIIY